MAKELPQDLNKMSAHECGMLGQQLLHAGRLDEAERCSRVGLMYRGRMVVCDTPERIKAMTKGELIALRPSDLRQARETLSGLAGVLEVQTFGEQLRIFAEDAEAVMDRARPALAAHGVGVLDVRRTQPRMEEAFISLIRQQRTETEA